VLPTAELEDDFVLSTDRVTISNH